MKYIFLLFLLSNFAFSSVILTPGEKLSLKANKKTIVHCQANNDIINAVGIVSHEARNFHISDDCSVINSKDSGEDDIDYEGRNFLVHKVLKEVSCENTTFILVSGVKENSDEVKTYLVDKKMFSALISN